jgi:tetratricopeptide (TPR) repeat protein
MLQILSVSLLLFISVPLGTSEFIAAKPQSSSPAQSQGQASTATSGPLQANPLAAISAEPGSALPNPLGEAKALYLKGDFDGSIQKYQELLQVRPTSPDAYAGLTRVYLKKKDVQQAYDTSTKVFKWPIPLWCTSPWGKFIFARGRFMKRRPNGST